MCNMMDGLVPVSSLLLMRLLPSRVAASGACVTVVVTISWRRRRWHRRVAAIACLWRSRRAVPRSCSPSRPIRCGGRFGLLLLPLPPSERSGPHLEIKYLFLLTDFECGTRNLSTFFPLRRAQNEAGMAGSTTESVGASTAEISGVFGRGVRCNRYFYYRFSL